MWIQKGDMYSSGIPPVAVIRILDMKAGIPNIVIYEMSKVTSDGWAREFKQHREPVESFIQLLKLARFTKVEDCPPGCGCEYCGGAG